LVEDDRSEVTKIIASHKNRFIYVALAKTASSSLKLDLAKNLGIHQGQVHLHEIPFEGIDRKFFNPAYQSYFKFTIVRNPWDRILSCYLNKIKMDKNFNNVFFRNGIPMTFERFGVFYAGMSFEQFVDEISDIPDEIADSHFRSQAFCVLDQSDNLLVDFVGRFENLKSDVERIYSVLNFDCSELPHLNPSPERSHYSRYYTAKTMKQVYERYRRDVEVFGYRFDSIHDLSESTL